MSFLGHVDKKLTDMAKNSEFEALEETALETAAMPYDKVKDENYAIRPAKSLKEVQEFWWPLVRDLGWVCMLNTQPCFKFLLTMSAPESRF